MKKFIIRHFFLFVISSFSTIAGNDQALTFDQAVCFTQINSPELKIIANEVGERIGYKIQTETYPNPIASYNVQQILGNKNWQGWQSAESYYQIDQLVELGGKRSCRNRYANFQIYAAQARYEAARQSVFNRLLKQFIFVAKAQESIQLTKKKKELAEKILNITSQKLTEGKSSILQLNKAKINLSAIIFDLEKKIAEYQRESKLLAAFWGSKCFDFSKVEWPFYNINFPEPLEAYLSAIENNPELIRSQYDYCSAMQNYYLKKAEVIPDVVLSVGYMNERNNNKHGLLFGASIPIPIFDRNQGNIKSARFEKQKNLDEYQATLLILESKLNASYQDLLVAHQEIDYLEKNALKLAQESYDLAKEGYDDGKYEYVELLDAQNNLFEIKEHYIEALMQFHLIKANILYLNSQD